MSRVINLKTIESKLPAPAMAKTVLLAAILSRLATTLIVYFWQGGTLFPDDETSVRLVARSIQGDTGKNLARTFDSQAAFYQPLKFVAENVSGSTMALQFMSVAIGSLVPLLLFWFLSKVVRPAVAFVGSMILALIPSQIVFSSLVLRDPYTWLSIVMVLTLVQGFRLRRSRPSRFMIAITLLPVLAYLGDLRFHTFLTVLVALLTTLVLESVRGDRWKLVLAVTLIPLSATTLVLTRDHLGQLGEGVDYVYDKVVNGTTGKGAERRLESIGARTSIECNWFLNSSEAELQEGWEEDLLCLPQAMAMFLFGPSFNQVRDNHLLIWLLPENLIWWIALYLGIREAKRVAQSHPEIELTGLLAVGLIAMWALIDRNFGTAFRHRGEVFVCLVILASVRVDRILTERSTSDREEGPG